MSCEMGHSVELYFLGQVLLFSGMYGRFLFSISIQTVLIFRDRVVCVTILF